MNFFQWLIKSMTGYFSRAAPPGPEPPQLPAVAAAPEEQPETITATAKDVQPAPQAASNGWEHLGSTKFLQWLGLGKDKPKAVENVTYFTCLKLLSETMAKMPIKVYTYDADGPLEMNPADDRLAYLLDVRPNPLMTPTTFWTAVENNRNHYGNAYVYIRRKFLRQKYGGQIELQDLWIMPSSCVRVVIDDAGVFAGAGRLWYVYSDQYTGQQYVFSSDDVLHFKTSHTFNGLVGESVQAILASTVQGQQASQDFLNDLYENGLTARAVLEYCADPKKLGAKTLFATHYHELTAMEAELPNVKNYNIAVKKRGKDMIFLRKIVPGAADESYGVEVANLAGLPGSVITRARQLLQELEAGAAPAQPVEKPEADQVSMLDMSGQAVCRELQKVAVETLTPIEAMSLLYELKQKLSK